MRQCNSLSIFTIFWLNDQRKRDYWHFCSNENNRTGSTINPPWLLVQTGSDWPEERFELRLFQRLGWEHFIDTSLLWLLAPEACRDVDRTNTSHAVEEQIWCLCCQDAGKGEQSGVRVTKEGGVKVTVDNGCNCAVIVSGELVRGTLETLELDSSLNTGLEWRCQHYDVIQFWSGPCCCGEAQLVLERLPCEQKESVATQHCTVLTWKKHDRLQLFRLAELKGVKF